MRNNPLDDVFSDELRVDGETQQHLKTLRSHIKSSGCQGCKLSEHRSGGDKPVPGEGRGRIMFVGHRIGGTEANRAQPAVGGASLYGLSLFLNVLPIRNRGMSNKEARDCILDYAYISNGARCAPYEKPTTSIWKKCAGPNGPNWLNQEMGLVDPAIVVFWNKQVARAVLQGEPPARGQVETREIYGRRRPVMLMTHPVRVAREPEEKPTVEGDYKRLVRWLYDEGYLETDPRYSIYSGANHHLVTTQEGLRDMQDDLWDADTIALDTETFIKGDLDHWAAAMRGEHEAKKGALLWFHPNFETVCYQTCALSAEGEVDDTYTVAMRFRDRMTGEPFQEITPPEAIGALDELLRHKPDGFDVRNVWMWNALFDCPVLTREGLDLWGMTHRDYPINIWDGQVFMGRLHEHMGGKEGRTTLDNAASIYLQERKGSFTDSFDIATFAFEDIRDDDVRQRLLAYCGEDPRKTILVGQELLDEWDEHVRERSRHLRQEPASMPVMGFRPFGQVNKDYGGPRIQDVAIPLDHQMVPMIGEMRMLGFQFESEAVEEVRRYADLIKRKLIAKIRDYAPGFKPNSSDDALSVLERAMESVCEEMQSMIDEAPDAERSILETFQLHPSSLKGEEVTPADIEDSFETGYGELNAQKATIKNKFLVFYQVSVSLLEDVAEDLGYDFELPATADPDRLKLFFEQVFKYKQVDKKFGTYFERFAELADRQDIIHPYYLLISTLSGRFSGNFQNVPRGGEEDIEFVKELLFDALGIEKPDDEEEVEKLVNEYNRFDVRQICRPVQAEDLNRMFGRMNLRYQDGPKKGRPWQVSEDDEYVIVTADYAGQEDRMAYALSGDETKARLLSQPDLDTHFFNVAYCFGPKAGYDTSAEEGQMSAYHHFTKQRQVKARKKLIRQIVEERDPDTGKSHGLLDGDTYAGSVEYWRHDVEEDPSEDLTGQPADSVIKRLQAQIESLKATKKDYKYKYRTPMKTVHYASQYGAGAQKLHTVLKPIFLSQGMEWSIEDTNDLKEKYDELYAGVTEAREEILDQLERIPYLEYPIFGTLRHASVDFTGEVQDGLSAANALNQGTCAYSTKTAMLRMRHLIEENAERWNLVHAGGDAYVGLQMQVHDEIAVLCPKWLAPEVSRALESAMKHAVVPLSEAKDVAPYYDTGREDYREETGYLTIPDEGFEGDVLFDADAEVKKSVAKAKTLASGEKNLLASMEDASTMEKLKKEAPPRALNEEHDLILAKAGMSGGKLL